MALPIHCIQPTRVFIEARIEGREQKCLADTGASVSLVSRQLVPGPLTPSSLKARGIGGEELQVLGQAKLQFHLGKDTFVHLFVAVGMTNTCILGADFLKASKMLVDVGNSKLSWPGGNVPLVVELTTPSVNKLSVLLENYADVFVTVRMIRWVVLETRNIRLTRETVDQSSNAPAESLYTSKPLLINTLLIC